MMRVSLNNIVNATDTFSKIMQQSFKGSLAFKIARLVRELKKELDTFNEERRKLLDKYCVKDENGEFEVLENGNIKLIPETVNEFNNELDTLMNTEIEINADKLPMDSIDDFDITPQEMMNLEVFFEE